MVGPPRAQHPYVGGPSPPRHDCTNRHVGARPSWFLTLGVRMWKTQSWRPTIGSPSVAPIAPSREAQHRSVPIGSVMIGVEAFGTMSGYWEFVDLDAAADANTRRTSTGVWPPGEAGRRSGWSPPRRKAAQTGQSSASSAIDRGKHARKEGSTARLPRSVRTSRSVPRA